VEIHEHLARRSVGRGDHVSTREVLYRGQVIDLLDEGRPANVPVDHNPVGSASPPTDEISATVPLSDEEGDVPKAEGSSIAAVGHGQAPDEEMKDAGELGDSEPPAAKDDGDHVSDASNVGDEDNERDAVDDDTAELAELWMRLSSIIHDPAIRAISLNIATGPVLTNHPAEKQRVICPKQARRGVVF
jgi:hypothetical protein